MKRFAALALLLLTLQAAAQNPKAQGCIDRLCTMGPLKNASWGVLAMDGNGKVLGEAYIGSRNYDAWASIIEGYLK